MMNELTRPDSTPARPTRPWRRCCTRYLPHRAVQHSHADVILSLTNLPTGDAVVAEVFGDSVVVVPYVMPGFDLAKVVRDLWPALAHEGTIGMVLMQHGLFTFGDDFETAYRRHRRADRRRRALAGRTHPHPGARCRSSTPSRRPGRSSRELRAGRVTNGGRTHDHAPPRRSDHCSVRPAGRPRRVGGGRPAHSRPRDTDQAVPPGRPPRRGLCRGVSRPTSGASGTGPALM